MAMKSVHLEIVSDSSTYRRFPCGIWTVSSHDAAFRLIFILIAAVPTTSVLHANFKNIVSRSRSPEPSDFAPILYVAF
ncbi:hypothetical protein FWK35_00021725 [Aphis craccivora]|uniref:Uncharacterized protein n=1 Tax=Aphis craccivora TaxID=307492 RepID=A0A6G0Y756_APHCR|nr:hypothetical protein FWK35_00021725 [Aphis craccivora]